MFIVSRKDEVFYDLFVEMSEFACLAATKLNDLINNYVDIDEKIADIKTVEHECDQVFHRIMKQLNKSFVTPIDREDIQALATMLNKITKKIAQAFMNLNVYRITNYTEEMLQQSKTIINATEELMRSVSLLKTISKTKEITESREAMKEIETFGDSILYRAIDKLFSGEFEAIEVIKLRDIYKGLESALDKCFGVSDAILTIALKNN